MIEGFSVPNVLSESFINWIISFVENLNILIHHQLFHFLLVFVHWRVWPYNTSIHDLIHLAVYTSKGLSLFVTFCHHLVYLMLWLFKDIVYHLLNHPILIWCPILWQSSRHGRSCIGSHGVNFHIIFPWSTMFYQTASDVAHILLLIQIG